MSKRTQWLMRAGIAIFAVFAMAQAPGCPSAVTETPTPAAPAITPAVPAQTAAAVGSSTAAPKAGSAASAGWDHQPLAVQFTIAPPYLSVGIACDKGLPPGAKV
ncbi:MAG: hypothetical protein EXR66_00615 [Dehalococcoidia bacterium]|nr:hypothetical protein [Dehalococcoidia bacterium]